MSAFEGLYSAVATFPIEAVKKKFYDRSQYEQQMIMWHQQAAIARKMEPHMIYDGNTDREIRDPSAPMRVHLQDDTDTWLKGVLE
jgi:hypothetical protein